MPALPEGHHLGQYRIIRLLGEGGMGAVYEARHESLDRRVAIKTLHSELTAQQATVTRFFNEAKALSKLEHPSIVQVSDFGTAPDGTTYLVMEYLRGESVGKRLRSLSERGERLPLASALQICWQVADVLAVAHSQGIIHRDIKPENLMLVADPIAPSGERVKVLDFGIAKLSGGNDLGGAKTATNTLMGTPMYMSPEQCSGAGRVDDRTDVYALGCVLYQSLAGRPPFEAEGTGELIGMHLYHSPPPLGVLAPKVPGNVVQLVHRMLAKDKAQRPDMSSTADQIGQLLKQHAGGTPLSRSRSAWGQDGLRGGDAVAALPPTTLGLSSGEGNRQRQIRQGLLIGLALSTLAIGVAVRPASLLNPEAGGRVPSGASDSMLKDLVSQPMEDLLASPQIHWFIESDPSGAQVIDMSGKIRGVTPWSFQQAQNRGRSQFTLRLDGFVDADLWLSETEDVKSKVVLTRKVPPPARTSVPVRFPQPQKRRELGYED